VSLPHNYGRKGVTDLTNGLMGEAVSNLGLKKSAFGHEL